jgi:hypothetical protein
MVVLSIAVTACSTAALALPVSMRARAARRRGTRRSLGLIRNAHLGAVAQAVGPVGDDYIAGR